MRDYQSNRYDSQPRAKRAVVQRAGTDGPALALTPDTLLRLQRSAGNSAVTSMLAVQRKKTPDYNDGQVIGMFTYLDDKSAPKRASIAVTDAWFS